MLPVIPMPSKPTYVIAPALLIVHCPAVEFGELISTAIMLNPSERFSTVENLPVRP